MMVTKKELRKQCLTARKGIDQTVLKRKETVIQNHLKTWLKSQNIKTVGLYIPIQNEIDVRPVFKDYNLVYPKVNKTMQFYSDNEGFVAKPMGTIEPKSNQVVLHDAIDLLIIPGLAYDKQGYRLGYGKAYFDQYLKTYKHITIGITLDQFLLESLPIENHDQKVMLMITEYGCIRSIQ